MKKEKDAAPQHQQQVSTHTPVLQGDLHQALLDHFTSPLPVDSCHDDYLGFADTMQFGDFSPKIGVAEQDCGLMAAEGEGLFPQLPELAGGAEEAAGAGEEKGAEIGAVEGKRGRRKRARMEKTSEEVENQRMTHIAVERNRRKQMNEHLRVLRSLMPGSYVQRGDQASIIGGAIEFVRELEQLLQCLESQKRRRIHDVTNPRNAEQHLPQLPPITVPSSPACGPMRQLCASGMAAFGKEMVQSKSGVADVEVRLAGSHALVKVLSPRRPGQLLKAIAALEELKLDILHANITTMEQVVLYSFNVKITSDARLTSTNEIASSVQQIFTSIDKSTHIV